MFARLTDFGHSAAHAPVLVQLPNPSSSILATIAFARAAASILPCGRRASWLTFAETNNIAEPVVVGDECCINLGLNEEPTVSNGGIPEDFANLILTVNLVKGNWAVGYLNMGGNADYITFDFSAYPKNIVSVTFDVTIPNWEETKNTVAYHWNNEENSLYYISGPSKENVTLTAPENAKSFTIQRSASTGTRIGQVCFELSDNTTPTEAVEPKQNECAAHKILRMNQVVIVREGKYYNLLGTPVD